MPNMVLVNYDNDKQSVWAKSDNCKTVCYLQTAWQMADIILKHFPDASNMLNEVLSNDEYKLCAEGCDQEKVSALWQAEMDYMGCRGNCSLQYENCD